MKHHDAKTHETLNHNVNVFRVLVLSVILSVLPYAARAASTDGNSVVVTIKSAALETDTDGDGLSDAVEAKLGTNPADLDTDGDGIDDAWEIANGLDPNDGTDAEQDPDGDGLTNLDEYIANTSPYAVDTDDDGYWDFLEIAQGSDPTDAGSQPKSVVYADVNCDGQVNAIDVQLVTNGALGLAVPAPVDVNKVGGVNALDVQIAINAAMGL